MLSLCLVANSSKVDLETVERNQRWIGSSEVIHFNKALHRAILPSENHALFLNCDFQNRTWFGLEENKNAPRYRKVYLYGLSEVATPGHLNEIGDQVIRVPFFDQSYPQSTIGNVPLKPSAAFCCWHYLRMHHRNTYLLGFTWEGWPYHDWEHEKNVFMKDSSVTILC